MSRALVLALLLAGCSRAEPPSEQAPATPPAKAPPAAPPAKATQGETPNAPLVLARGIRFVKAEPGDVHTLIRNERERAVADDRQLIVYVGATWCEPCQRFHAAAKRGELDTEFPNLTFLEFDLDDDRERLLTAGYESRLIPFFVLPDAQGRATARRFEGGMKGEQAVASIAPRLRTLLAKP